MGYVAAFRTYEWDEDIAKIAKRFFDACPNAARKVVLANETQGKLDVPYEKISHTENSAQLLGLPKSSQAPILWFNNDYTIYLLRQALPGYDHYLISESDLMVNIDLDQTMDDVVRRRLDIVVHAPIISKPKWYWYRNGEAAFGERFWQVLLFFIIISDRAAEALLLARQRMAQELAEGTLKEWPFCESFVPTILKSIPDMRFGELSEYADVSNLRYRPRISLEDPRATGPGSLVHSVVGKSRYKAGLFSCSRDYFECDSELRQMLDDEALKDEPLEEFAPRLIEALRLQRDHRNLMMLNNELAARGVSLPSGAGILDPDDIAMSKPALSSSVSKWSWIQDREGDANGANAKTIQEYGFHTDEEDNPWWMVDLMGEFLVDSITILNREAGADRFKHFQIESSLDRLDWTRRFIKLDEKPVSSDPACPWLEEFSDPFVCRYVKITLLGRGPLHLRQVRVFGRAIDSRQG